MCQKGELILFVSYFIASLQYHQLSLSWTRLPSPLSSSLSIVIFIVFTQLVLLLIISMHSVYCDAYFNILCVMCWGCVWLFCFVFVGVCVIFNGFVKNNVDNEIKSYLLVVSLKVLFAFLFCAKRTSTNSPQQLKFAFVLLCFFFCFFFFPLLFIVCFYHNLSSPYLALVFFLLDPQASSVFHLILSCLI